MTGSSYQIYQANFLILFQTGHSDGEDISAMRYKPPVSGFKSG